MEQPSFPFAQRWRDRREHRRPLGQTIIPSEYGVDVIPSRVARSFVIRHHYSASYPADRLAVGLFHKPGIAPSELVGAAVFSVPMNQAVVPRYTGLDPALGVELGRLVVLPSVVANGESWFIKRAFAELRQTKPEVRAVVSMADPLELQLPDGTIRKNGHFGTIYQASNAHFCGRTRSRVLRITPDCTVLSERALSKIRLQERGHAYAEATLVAAGAEPRNIDETPETWLNRSLLRIGARRVQHPGNFVYAFGLDQPTHRAIAAVNAPLAPYPKKCAA